MGKLQDKVRQLLQMIRQERQKPAPNHLNDPDAAYEYQVLHNDLKYLEKQIPYLIMDQIRQLPPEDQIQLYNEAVIPEKAAAMTVEQFQARIKEVTSDNGALLAEELFGKPVDEIAEALEKVLGEEKSEELVEEIGKTPRDPEFPEDQAQDYPFDAQIQNIKNSIPEDDPQREEDLAMLDAVREDLADVKPEVLEFLNDMDHQTDNLPGLTEQMDGISYDALERFAEQDQVLDLKNKAPKTSGGHYDFLLLNPADYQNDPEKMQHLNSMTVTVPDNVKNYLTQVEEQFDRIGEAKLKAGENGIGMEKLYNQPMQITYRSEQSHKMYGFRPLTNAKLALGEAVQSGNRQRIRQAYQEYAQLNSIYRELMELAQEGPKIYSGNVNSTRPGGNHMPLEFVRDYAGHNKVNSLFLLHGAAKGLGVSVTELVEKPIQVMQKGAENYNRTYGLKAKRSLGNKLAKGLSDMAAFHFTGNWFNTQRLVGRGISAAAGLLGKEEGAKIFAQADLAGAVSKWEVDKEGKQWEDLAKANKDQRDVLYQHAALLPEDEFDLAEMATALKDPDWEENLSTEALVQKLRSEGKLDYRKLSQRTQEVLEDCEPTYLDKFGQPQPYETTFGKDDYVRSAHKAYVEILKSATPEEKEREDFKIFEKHVHSMHRLARKSEVRDAMAREEFAAGLITERELNNRLDEGITREIVKVKDGRVDLALSLIETRKPMLNMKKEGFFISSTNSPEHQAMTKAVDLLALKLKIMRNEATLQDATPEQQKLLKKYPVKELLNSAWNATYTYLLKSDENGTKKKWEYLAGKQRNKAAGDMLKNIRVIGEELEINSPAELAKMKLREEIHNKRMDENWMEDKFPQEVAKDICIMTMHYGKVKPEKQATMLKDRVMKNNIAKVGQDDAFQRLFQNYSRDELAEMIIVGKGKLTDAYIKCKKEIAKEEHLQDPVNKKVSKLTAQDRENFWSQHKISPKPQEPKDLQLPHA